MGRKKVVGSPLLYGSTKGFLHHFGLNSLEDLPSIEDFEQFVDALEGPDGVLAGLPEAEQEEKSGGDDEVPTASSEDAGNA